MCFAHRFGSSYPSRMHCGLKALRAHHSHHKHCGLLPCVRASLFFSEGTTSDKSPARDPSPAGARPAGIKRCGHRHTSCVRCSTADTKMRCGHTGPARLGEAALEGGADTLAPQPHAAYTPLRPPFAQVDCRLAGRPQPRHAPLASRRRRRRDGGRRGDAALQWRRRQDGTRNGRPREPRHRQHGVELDSPRDLALLRAGSQAANRREQPHRLD